MAAGSQAWPRPRGERREKTRQGVVDAALELFRERGHLGVRVEDIVEAAGISRATFYKYFSERDQILAELFERLLGSDSGHPAVPARATARAEITLLLVETARRMVEQKELAGFVYSMPVRHEALVGRSGEPKVFDRVRAAVRRGVDTGELRGDADLVNASLARAFEGAMRDWAEGRAPDALQRVAVTLDMIFDGVAVARARSKSR